MIISASYRTDIPAFYGQWFVNRLQAGFAMAANPYGGAPSRIDLTDTVDGFVFWTRNARPFLPALDMLRDRAIPFVVSYTAIGYPRAIESHAPSWQSAVETMGLLADRFGPHAVVWRYDPVLVCDLTPPHWHLDQIDRIARPLQGRVNECVLSFVTLYRKTLRNLAAHGGIVAHQTTAEQNRQLAAQLAQRLAACGLRASLCSQNDYLAAEMTPAACVDARRLEQVAADWGQPRSIKAPVKGNRPDCRCHQSRDIGAYDTCTHGCRYCYAVGSYALARQRLSQHDPHCPFLFA